MDLQFFIQWFTDLKNDGVSKEDVLDILEFESDVYPDEKLMKEARELVYGSQS